jgi:hypothetical protein
MPQRLPIVLSLVALAVALLGATPIGEAARNAVVPSRGSVGTPQLKNNAVTTLKVRNFTLRAVDFKKGQLPRGAQGPAGPAGAQGPAGPQGAQGVAGVSGLQKVFTTGASSSGAVRSLTATCPAGKEAIGGGGIVLPANQVDIALTGSYPVTQTTWRATARELDETGANWSLNAVVICAAAT